jgi:hypothetical protein
VYLYIISLTHLKIDENEMEVDLKSLLLKIDRLSTADAKELGEKLYDQLYITSPRVGIHKTHDGEEVFFWFDRFTHAFHYDKAKTLLDRGRVARIRWIGEIVAGSVPAFECWLVDKTPQPDNRLYIVWGENYVVWLEPRPAGGWKFSTAYPAERDQIKGYIEDGERIWPKNKDAPD